MLKTVNRVLALLILAAVCFIGITAYPYVRAFFLNRANVGVFTQILTEEIRRIGELNTLERTETGKLSAEWLGTPYVAAEYAVRAKYGVDLSGTTFDIDPAGGVVTVTLPDAALTSMAMDVGEFKSTGVLSVFKPLDESTRLSIVNAKRAELQAKYGGDASALDQAWDSAVEQLRGLFDAALKDAAGQADGNRLLIEFQTPSRSADGATAREV